MGYKSNLGQQSGGGPSSGGPGSPAGSPGGVTGAGPMTQGGFTPLVPGQFPVGMPLGPVCPPGYLPAPSAIVPNGYTCIRAPGSYTLSTLAGKR